MGNAQVYFLCVHIVVILVFLKEPDCIRVFGKGLGFHEAICKGRDCMGGTHEIRWQDETVPLGHNAQTDKLLL